MAFSAASSASQPPFEFSPQLSQDADLLKQLNFVPGLKEVLMLRQVHALEHATVWVLGEQSNGVGSANQEQGTGSIGGMSTDEGFYLYGQVNSKVLDRAVRVALQRLVEGEWDLAVHPRCGTNLSVGMLMTASLAFGMHLLLPKGPLEQILAVGLAATTAAHLAEDVGSLVQRYITTAIPFNLALVDVSSSCDRLGNPVHFVRVRWRE